MTSKPMPVLPLESKYSLHWWCRLHLRPKISSYMLAGSTLSWFVLMPAIALFGADAQAIFPATDPIAQMAPSDLWGTYIKYIGAGAVATGGVISLIKSLPLIAKTFKQAMQSMKKKSNASALRTEQDIPMPFLLVMILVIGIAIRLVPAFWLIQSAL